jgi:hypothetical protein
MLLSEIVFNIKNLLAGGVESDDENLSNEQLVFIINYYRAKLLKQDQEKGRQGKGLYVQNLGKVPLVQADKNECCEGDCILRTASKIPSPLETYKGLNLTFVGTLNGRPFDKQEHNSVIWNKGAKFTWKEPKWYYQNGYIYLVNPPSMMIQDINIQGIFEEPMLAESFRTCDCPGNNSPCTDPKDNLDFTYPLPLHHVDTIVKLIVQTEITVLTGMLTDYSNNGVDNQRGVTGPARNERGI